MNNLTPDEKEAIAAVRLMRFLKRLASENEAQVGILLKAFDVLTADLSINRRNVLLRGENE